MKRVRCPQCSQFVTFDETGYALDQTLAFTCPHCGKRFAIRRGVARRRAALAAREAEEARRAVNVAPMGTPETEERELEAFGSITVIENVFHYKQVLPLVMGENVIGRYQKGVDNNCAIHTDDPSIDITHCYITVSRDKNGGIKYVLRDGPSNTGTFVDNDILGDRERRVIEPGQMFTIGATSVILKGEYTEE